MPLANAGFSVASSTPADFAAADDGASPDARAGAPSTAVWMFCKLLSIGSGHRIHRDQQCSFRNLQAWRLHSRSGLSASATGKAISSDSRRTSAASPDRLPRSERKPVIPPRTCRRKDKSSPGNEPLRRRAAGSLETLRRKRPIEKAEPPTVPQSESSGHTALGSPKPVGPRCATVRELAIPRMGRRAPAIFRYAVAKAAIACNPFRRSGSAVQFPYAMHAVIYSADSARPSRSIG